MPVFHLSAQILKPPDQAGDVPGPVQPVEVIRPGSFLVTGPQQQDETELGPEVTPEYGLITPIRGHSVAQSIPGTLLHAPGSLKTDGQLFSKECESRFNYGSSKQQLRTLKRWLRLEGTV